MKKLSKIVSVVLSLALCLGMASPAFAASFTDLQNAIDGNEGTGTAIKDKDGNETGRYGYSWNDATDDKEGYWGIEAWDGTRTETVYDENGDIAETKEGVTTRYVQLNEDVNYGEVAEGEKDQNCIVIKGDVTLDLNGHDIDRQPDAVLNTDDGKFYKAEKDDDGNKVATSEVAELINTWVIDANIDESRLTINDSSGDNSGSITGGTRGAIYGDYITLNGGSITGNSAWTGGGINGGILVMNGGSVNNNYANLGGGGGVAGNLILNDGEISGNTSAGGGGGVIVNSPNARFIMKGGVISENHTGGQGGGVMVNTATCKFTMNGGTITDNSAAECGGVLVLNSNFEMTGGSISVENGETVIVKTNGNRNSQMIKNGGTISGDTVFYTDKDCKGTNTLTVGDISYVLSSEPSGGKQIITIEVKDANGEIINKTATTALLPAGTKFKLDTSDPSNPRIELLEKSLNTEVVETYGYGGYVDNTGFHPYRCHDIAENIVEDAAVSPTCTETGLTEGSHCSVCGKTVVKQEEIPAKGHDMGEWVVTTPALPGIRGVETRVCSRGDHTETRPIPALPVQSAVTPGDAAGADVDTTIADQEVPLAALFTRADAIGYLWEQSGSPEAELSDFPDVPEDHRWAVAIGWAQDAGIALPDEDGNFRPDDLVLRASGEPEGELQEFLNRYAVYAGIELDEGELFIVLEGAADDIIMGADAQVIFDGFFAKLEAALQEKAA